MSSPGARQRRRRQQYQTPRARRDIAIAAGAGTGIVTATLFMIWLLRPGGLADRQPRSSWLVGLAFIAAVVAGYAILRPDTRVKVDRRLALSGSLAAILVIAVAAGIFWPGGIIRHIPKAPTFVTTPTTPLSTTTAAPGTTTKPGNSTIPANSTTTKPSP